MIQIYSLVDLTTNKVRYVGMTGNSLKWRLKAHVYKATSGSQYHVHRWLRRIKYKARIQLLEIVKPSASWEKAECKWIRHYRKQGCDLTNSAEGGRSSRGCKWSDQSKKKLSKVKIAWYRENPYPKVSRLTRLKRSRSLRLWNKTHDSPSLGRIPSPQEHKNMSRAQLRRRARERRERKLKLCAR